MRQSFANQLAIVTGVVVLILAIIFAIIQA